MKKIRIALIITLIMMCGSCVGYKPILSSSNLNFKIMDYSLEGENVIAKKIYYKLNNLSKSKNNKSEKRKINLKIEILKDKQALSKDSAGQALEYKITLKSKILVTDFSTNNELLSYDFSTSSRYSVQDQYSNTIKFEKNSIDSLIDTIYEGLIIKLTDSIVSR